MCVASSFRAKRCQMFIGVCGGRWETGRGGKLWMGKAPSIISIYSILIHKRRLGILLRKVREQMEIFFFWCVIRGPVPWISIFLTGANMQGSVLTFRCQQNFQGDMAFDVTFSTSNRNGRLVYCASALPIVFSRMWSVALYSDGW